MFEEAPKFEMRGVTFVIITLTCFAVPISDLLKKGKILNEKGDTLWMLDMTLTTSGSIGKLLLPMLGAVYWLER